MEQLRDHPGIRAMERTGYYKQPKVVCQCSECDSPIYEGEDAYKFSFGWICENCADWAYQEVRV